MTQAAGIEVIAPADASDDVGGYFLPGKVSIVTSKRVSIAPLPGFPVKKALFVF